MRIWNEVYNIIFDRIMANENVVYSGTYNSDPKSPLWGRAAYYHIGHHKITFPVRSIKSSEKTLRKLLKAELRRRFEAIQEVVECNDHGEIYIRQHDPCSIRSLLKTYATGFIDIPFKKRDAV